MSYSTLKYTEFVEFGLKFFPVTFQKAILENNFNTEGIRSKPVLTNHLTQMLMSQLKLSVAYQVCKHPVNIQWSQPMVIFVILHPDIT